MASIVNQVNCDSLVLLGRGTDEENELAGHSPERPATIDNRSYLPDSLLDPPHGAGLEARFAFGTEGNAIHTSDERAFFESPVPLVVPKDNHFLSACAIR